MTGSGSPSSKRGLLLKLGVVVAVAAILAALLLRGVNLRELIDQVLAWIRSVGPGVFFAAMVVLPALGFPLLAFTLPAGPVFGPQLGMPMTILLVLLSLTLNLALTYWLARYAFRPLLEGLIRKLGYGLPKVSAEDHLSLAILVRVTPGPPFFVQGYLLGLAGIPFRIYMLVSLIFTGAFSVAVVLFGDSLMNGRGKLALLAFSVIVALSVLVQWLRRRYAKKKLAPSTP